MIMDNQGRVGTFDNVFRHYSYKELQSIPKEQREAEARKFLSDKRQLEVKLKKGNIIYVGAYSG